MLKRVNIVSLIGATIGPGLFPLAILEVIFPLSPIHSTINILKNAKPMRLIILPLPIVDMPIAVYQLPLSITVVVDPLALIDGAIGPNLLSNSVPFSIEILPFVGRAIVVLEGAKDRVVLCSLEQVFVNLGYVGVEGVSFGY